ncbi:MAG TPA: adenylate/guanylate cyclase domain-containing protein [Burkholderiales bacterium]|jgi:adenylate cyclase
MFKEQLLKDALRLYAGQHVLDRVLREGRQALEYTTVRQVMTVMFIDFADIFPADFSGLTPDMLRSWRQGHHELVAECVAEHEGIVDTLMGDAVIAHWGMTPQVDHAALALRCAEKLQAEVSAIDAHHQARGLPGRRLMMGIHSGMVDLGNHGTPNRARYTVMGDAVNLASRLANRCNEYRVPALLTDAALALAGNAVATSEVDAIRVKGKDGKVTLHTLGKGYVRREASPLPSAPG